jgi:hypothetical protein
MIGRARKVWRDSGAYKRVALVLLVFSVVGWPATAVLDWLGWPIFQQVMIFLSWGALGFAAFAALAAADTGDAGGTGCELCPHCHPDST